MRAINNARGTVGEPTFNYLTVTIGRNVGTEPLSAPDWERFQRLVNTAVWDVVGVTWGNHTVETHYGTGEWGGVQEQSAILSYRLNPGHEFTSGVVANLSRALVLVAREYNQDAVAVAYGRTVLVESK